MKVTSFKDIPKFPQSSYRCSVGLKYLPTMLQGYMYDYRLEMNPDFQRGHVWTKEQQILFMEFRLKGGMSGQDIYFNCPEWGSGKSNKMVCVDGLQRVSAAMAFLFGQIPVFGSYVSEFEESVRAAGLDNLFTFHVADLRTEKEILEWYVSLNAGGTPHSKEEIDRVRKMIDNG